MVKRIIIGCLALVSASYAAEVRYYYDRPTQPTLSDNDRVLFYNSTGATRDRNITGAGLKGQFAVRRQPVMFSSISTNTLSSTRNIFDDGYGNSLFSGTMSGSVSSGGNLTFTSTTNSTKGKIKLGSASAYDEAQTRLGIGTQSPTSPMHVVSLPTYGGATIAIANVSAKAAGHTIGAFYKYSTAASRVVGVVW